MSGAKWDMISHRGILLIEFKIDFQETKNRLYLNHQSAGKNSNWENNIFQVILEFD